MIRNAPSTVSMPTPSGSSAATTPRNTNSENRNSSGKASNSARARSSETCVPTCGAATASPPRVTSGPSARSSRSVTTSSSVPVRVQASRYADRPSRERSPGATRAIPGSARSTASASAVGPRTSAITVGSADAPVARWTSRLACSASAFGSSKSDAPVSSRPATGPPSAPARKTNTTAVARTRRRRVSVKRARASNTTPWIVSDYLLFCQARSPGSLTPSSIHV